MRVQKKVIINEMNHVFIER